jgi:cytidylate kinase
MYTSSKVPSCARMRERASAQAERVRTRSTVSARAERPPLAPRARARAHRFRVEHVLDCDDVLVVEVVQDLDLAQRPLRLGQVLKRL